MTDEALAIPIVANQGEFNRAMKDILRTSNATAEQVRKKFAKDNPDAARMFNRFTENQARAYDRLAQRLDPVVRSTRQYESVQDQLAVALKSGAISQEQANRLLDQARGRYVNVSAAANAATVANRNFLNMSNQGRFILNNTTNQLSDMMVQFEMGTNPMRVMGQQLPQVAGGFAMLGGPIGIVAGLMGTAAAIGFPLAASFINVGEETESLEKKMKALESSISAVKAAQDKASVSSSDLLDEYGGLADHAREIFEINRQIAALQAQTALDGLADNISEDLGAGSFLGVKPEMIREAAADTSKFSESLGKIKVQLDAMSEEDAGFWDLHNQAEKMDVALTGVESGAKGISDALGITGEKAAEVLALFTEVAAAKGAQQQADAMSRLTAYVNEVTGGLETADEVGHEFYQTLLSVTTQALELAKIDLSSPVADAADEAERLADNLEAARAAQFDKITGGNPDFFDTRGESPNAGRIIEHRPVPRQNRPGYTPPKKPGGRKERGLFEPSEDTLEKLRRQIEMIGMTRAEIAEYTAKQDLLNEARKRGLDLDAQQAGTGQTLREEIDRQAKSVGRLTEQYDGATNQTRFWNRQNEDLKSGLLDAAVEGENLSGTLDGVAKALARAAMEAALFNTGPLKDLFGLGGGIFSGGGGTSNGGTPPFLPGGGSGSGGLFGGAIIPGILHTGGIAGSDGYGHGRSFSPDVWAGAPRYHQGGIAGLRPGEVPAILEEGELISPKGFRPAASGRQAAPSSVRMTVNVEGANGDQHVINLVQQGVEAGMNQVRQEVPDILAENEKRNR